MKKIVVLAVLVCLGFAAIWSASPEDLSGRWYCRTQRFEISLTIEEASSFEAELKYNSAVEILRGTFDIRGSDLSVYVKERFINGRPKRIIEPVITFKIISADDTSFTIENRNIELRLEFRRQ